MQVETTRGIGYLRREESSDGGQASAFRALFVLSSSKGVSPGVLRKQLGLSRDDFGALIDRLQRLYLVDSLSELRGESVVEYYSITDEGRSALQSILERMCELPEAE